MYLSLNVQSIYYDNNLIFVAILLDLNEVVEFQVKCEFTNQNIF